MDNLKPCPFCGGEANVWLNIKTDNYEIECQKCFCVVQHHFGCRDEAIEAWNKRKGEGE